MSKCLCPFKMISYPWKVMVEDGTPRRWLGHEGGALMQGISTCSLSPPCEDTMRSLWLEKGPQLTMSAPCSQTSSLQNCKQWIAVVYKPPSLLYFVIAAPTDWDKEDLESQVEGEFDGKDIVGHFVTATHLFMHLTRQVGNTYFSDSIVCTRDAKTSKLDKVSSLKMITV